MQHQGWKMLLLKLVMQILAELTSKLHCISIQISLVINLRKKIRKFGLKSKKHMRLCLIQLKGKNMTQLFHSMKKYLMSKKIKQMTQIFLKFLENVLQITLDIQQLNLYQILEIKIQLLMRYKNSINFGIVLRHGENLVNMMNTTPKKLKIGMKKDGWKNKTKK